MQSMTFWGAFSMSSSQRSKWYLNSNKDVPAPKYKISQSLNKTSSPHHIIGTGERSSIVDNRKIPGPGQYNTLWGTQNSKGPKILGRIKLEDHNDGVSPAQYAPKSTLVQTAQPSFTFTYRNGEVWSKNTPGPDHYFRQEDETPSSTNQSWCGSTNTGIDTPLQQMQKKILQAKMNKGFTISEKLKTMDNGAPGIGIYSITQDETRACTPSYKFPQNRRSLSNVDTTIPGPGAFNLRTDKVSGYKFSMGTSVRAQSTLDKRKNILVGPGYYDPKPVEKDVNQGYSFGPIQNEKRNSTSGNRNKQSNKNEERQREEERRQKKAQSVLINRKNPTPGPSDYSNTFYFDQKAQEAKILGQYRDLSQQYEPQRFNEKHLMAPGPADYEQNCNIIKKRHPTIKISEKHTSEIVEPEILPGPGEYLIQTTLKNNQAPLAKIGRSKRPTQVRNTLSVGPGSYSIENCEIQNKIISIGTQNRFTSYFNNQPGPGFYNIQGDIAKLPSYMLKRKISNISQSNSRSRAISQIDMKLDDSKDQKQQLSKSLLNNNADSITSNNENNNNDKSLKNKSEMNNEEINNNENEGDIDNFNEIELQMKKNNSDKDKQDQLSDDNNVAF